MSWLRRIWLLMLVLGTLVSPRLASAQAPLGLETRVGGLDLAAQVIVGVHGLASPGSYLGNPDGYDENASGCSLAARGAGGGGKLWWGFWKDYPKVMEAGREYAQIGERLYTQHAVQRMLPASMGGRSIAPGFVEQAIATGSTSTQVVNGVTRTLYTSGNVQVVTEQGGRIVVTVMHVGAP